QPLPGGGGGGRGGLPISAIPGNAAPAVGTPWANPGTYTVKLTVNGKTFTQPVTVRQDPRVKTSVPVMQQVYAQTRAVYDAAVDVQAAGAQVASLRTQIATLRPQASGAAATQLAAFDERLAALQAPVADAGFRGGREGRAGGAPAEGRGGRGGAQAASTLPALTALTAVMNSLQGADVQPTAVQMAAIADARAAAAQTLTRWTTVRASLT